MKYLVIFLIIFLAMPAVAQTKAELEAYRLYKEAQKAMEEKRFDDAIKLLDEAFEKFPKEQILIKKAEALRAKGELLMALEVLRKIKTEDRKIQEKVSGLISEIAKELNEPVDVEVRTNVDGAELIVDQIERYVAPCVIKITRGVHHFEIRKQGYAPMVFEKNVGAPETRAIEVELQKVTAKVVVVTDLDSFDGVIVRLDSQEFVPKGTTMAPNRTEPMDIEPGTHKFLCVKQGVPSFMGEFRALENSTVEVMCRLRQPEKKKKSKTWGIVLASTGGAVAVGGAALVGWYYYYKGSQKTVDEAGNRYHFVDRHENYVGFALIGAGVAIGASSLFFFIDSGGQRRFSSKLKCLAVTPFKGGAGTSALFEF